MARATVPKRKYQSVWERLKTAVDKRCIVEVHKLIVDRVCKAVVKEKDIDTAFKLANKDDPVQLRIKRLPSAKEKHFMVEFKLRQRFGISAIKKESEIELWKRNANRILDYMTVYGAAKDTVMLGGLY